MHSLKNTVVAVLLLGVSYGVYEVLTTPDPAMTTNESLIGPLVISEGDSFDETTPQPHIELPDAIPLSPGSPSDSFPSDKSVVSGWPDKVQPPATPASSFQPPSSAELTVPRQPNMDFGSGIDMGNQPAGGETMVDKSQLPHDHELIAALQQQLGPEAPIQSNINADLMNSGVAPAGQMVSTIVSPNPESTDIGSFQPAVDPELSTGKTQLAESQSVDFLAFDEAWPNVEQMLAAEQYRNALQTLTQYYGDSSLTADQQQKLQKLLDGLAGKVIYSPEHHFSPQPHVVQENDSLESIAQRWNVTEQLVYNLNRDAIPDSANLSTGTELKVISGPFHGELNVTKKVLTVFVEDLYAGRFSVELGNGTEIAAGRYPLESKSKQPMSGECGPFCMKLEGDYCIHEVDGSSNLQHKQCIGLNHKDASDLFSIFTEDSVVFIK